MSITADNKARTQPQKVDELHILWIGATGGAVMFQPARVPSAETAIPSTSVRGPPPMNGSMSASAMNGSSIVARLANHATGTHRRRLIVEVPPGLPGRDHQSQTGHNGEQQRRRRIEQAVAHVHRDNAARIGTDRIGDHDSTAQYSASPPAGIRPLSVARLHQMLHPG
jgi:hypothetical protein